MAKLNFEDMYASKLYSAVSFMASFSMKNDRETLIPNQFEPLGSFIKNKLTYISPNFQFSNGFFELFYCIRYRTVWFIHLTFHWML